MRNEIKEIMCSFGPSYVCELLGNKPAAEYIFDRDLIYIPGLGYHTADEAEARMYAILAALDHRANLKDSNGALMYARRSGVCRPWHNLHNIHEGRESVLNEKMGEGLRLFAKEESWTKLRSVPSTDPVQATRDYYVFTGSLKPFPWMVATEYLNGHRSDYTERNFQEGYGL